MNNHNEVNLSSNFATNDFLLATTLASLGFRLNFIDKANPKKVVFYFPQDQELNAALEGYWRDKLSVEPKRFGSKQRELKARIHFEK